MNTNPNPTNLNESFGKRLNYRFFPNGLTAFEIAYNKMSENEDNSSSSRAPALLHHRHAVQTELLLRQKSLPWIKLWETINLESANRDNNNDDAFDLSSDGYEKVSPSSLPSNDDRKCQCCKNGLCQNFAKGFKKAIIARSHMSEAVQLPYTGSSLLCAPVTVAVDDGEVETKVDSNRNSHGKAKKKRSKVSAREHPIKSTRNKIEPGNTDFSESENCSKCVNKENTKSNEKVVSKIGARNDTTNLIKLIPNIFPDGIRYFIDEKNNRLLLPLPIKSRLYDAFPCDWKLSRQKDGKWRVKKPGGEYYNTLLGAQQVAKKLVRGANPNKCQKHQTKDTNNRAELIKRRRSIRETLNQRSVKENGNITDFNESLDISDANASNSYVNQHPLTRMWEENEALLGALPVWDDTYFADTDTGGLKSSATIESIDHTAVSERSSKRSRKSTNTLPYEVGRHSMVEPKYYSPPGQECADVLPQPFQVKVHPQLPFLVEFHAALAKVEIIGVLGGKFVDGTLFIQSALPCVAMESGGTDVEMDSVDLIRVLSILQKHDLSFVGWYHSHPTFAPFPSSTDIRNQSEFQHLFRIVDSEIEPYVGLIVRPPSKNISSVREHTWFHIQQFSKKDDKYHRLISMGYTGIRLNERDDTGTFCMRMHASIRVRRNSIADMFFQNGDVVKSFSIKQERVEEEESNSLSSPALMDDLSLALSRLENFLEGLSTHLVVAEKSIRCTCCSLNVVNSDSAKESVLTIIEKLERHLLNPRHLFASAIQSSESESSYKVNNQKLSLDKKNSKNYALRKCVCICRHYETHSLSVGPLKKCHANISSCGGFFHPSCCSGGFRLSSLSSIDINDGSKLNQDQLICILCAQEFMKKNKKHLFESVWNDDTSSILSLAFKEINGCKRSMKYSISLSVSDAYPEIKGMISQVEALIKYYSLWGNSRRSDLCRISNSGRTPVKTNTSIDQCDRLRLAISHNLVNILNCTQTPLDDSIDSIMDYICKFARFTWRWPKL